MTPFKVVLTGGGTAGHVMPHIALLPDFKAQNWEVLYVGSSGIERDLILKQGIRFLEIKTGKLRRYMSFRNFTDLFRIVFGVLQSFWILRREKPQVVFSKGGFVSVPVAIAAWVLGIPVVSHESDLSPGLANRIIAKFAKKLLYCFPDTKRYIPAAKGAQVGLPVRRELRQGQRQIGAKRCGFVLDERPTVLFMGGSQGAQTINDAVVTALAELTASFQVVHLTGSGKATASQNPRYCQFEFVHEGLADLLALADIVVARSGANSIFEFLALRKPMILIPLEKGSRGDQVANAMSFESHGWAMMLREKDLSAASLLAAIGKVWGNKDVLREQLAGAGDAVQASQEIIAVLKAVARGDGSEPLSK